VTQRTGNEAWGSGDQDCERGGGRIHHVIGLSEMDECGKEEVGGESRVRFWSLKSPQKCIRKIFGLVETGDEVWALEELVGREALRVGS